MAVGIACAGTGSLEATNLLEPLLRDRVDYVRQSAFIALGMVFMQQNEKAEPKVGRYNKSVFSVLAGRGDTMTKLGAILGQGIMNAGGRNVSISLLSPSGFKKMEAVVGMAMFQQFWYWHPFINFLSLSFTPTTVIGLNKNLQMPESFNVVSNAKPSLFAYPEEVSLEVKKEAVELKKATLSTSSKAKRKAKEKKNAEVDADGDVKMGSVTATTEGETKEATEEAEKKPEPEPEPEAESAVLANPSRVTPLQWKHVTLSDVANSRYQLVKKLASGFVMLQDTTPDVPERIVVPHAPGFSVPGVSADEPEAPEPFELPERYL
jgi:26S proteasome regulatory subunit N2